MDIRISVYYECLINDLLPLKSLTCCKKEKKFINLCIEQIEKIAILRSNLKYLSGSEKDIEHLNNTEAEFKEKLYRIITYFEIMDTYEQLNSLPRFFAGISCFAALTTIGLIISVVLINIAMPPLVGILLIFALAASLIIFQTSLSILGKSPVLPYMEDKITALTKMLKKIIIGLEQNIRVVENKINFQEINNLKFAMPSAPFLQNTSFNRPQTYLSMINFFKKNELADRIISTKNYSKKINHSFYP